MRKHSVRKFIHAVLDCLPLIVIPIFAIYSQNHEINDNTLQVQENLKVDFNQLYKSVTVSSTTLGITRTPINGNGVNLNGTLSQDNAYINVSSQQINIYAGHKYAFTGATAWKQINANNMIHIQYSGSLAYINTDGVYTASVDSNPYIYVLANSNGQTYDYDFYFSLFDLTQMFGSGNEPTYNEFITYFPNSYYEYTESQEMYIENAYTTTYDDTDIMSQFMYQEYNFMDKYLGIYKYQPFAGIYSWIQNTFFNANAPLVFTIFYQWFAYWLFVSLCWLVFDVLIYVPMVAHRWLDKGALE